jgi:flagellar biosynthesis protein FlhA
MAQQATLSVPKLASKSREIGFALGIVMILSILFLPIPAFLIDMGLAFSIAFSVLILMVALWIQRPLEFSSFPTILLISTMTRLSLNMKVMAPPAVSSPVLQALSCPATS